ncbi:MAG: ssl1498 family light-harvesting-like protein [Microcoleus vaginatus WJT46-NPBG5]|jgi:hypothetical protein|nr:ssl1498 family light-harvesting-like protein [Microcoleus vaginatus WJT46-NPBG5]
MYTTDDNGILNNYATEPDLYYSEFPSPEQQRQYAFVGGVATLFVSFLVLVALSAG